MTCNHIDLVKFSLLQPDIITLCSIPSAFSTRLPFNPSSSLNGSMMHSDTRIPLYIVT